MFIPVGLDQNEVRRTPWVSIVLIAANVLIFTVLWFSEQQSGRPAELRDEGRAAYKYLLEHPYVSLPQEIEAHLNDEDRRELDAARNTLARAGRVPADWEIAKQQKQFDEMLEHLSLNATESPILRWGYVPARPKASRVLTHMFMHADWLHLIFNMIFLYITGFFVEDAYGRILFPILYFLSGLAALGVHVVHNPASTRSLVGASGAIAGIMGAFLVRYTKRKIDFAWMPFFPIPWIWKRFYVPALIYIPFWFLTQVFVSSVSGEEADVAVWAHIGGFLFGFLAALLIAILSIERKYVEPVIQKQVGGPENAELLRAIQAGGRGDFAEARRATGRVLVQDPHNLDARRYAYQVAFDSRDSAEIGIQATRLLDAYIQHGEKQLAHDLVLEVVESAPPPLPPGFSLRAGDFLARQGDSKGALHVYERLFDSHPGEPSGLRALLQSAELRAKMGESRRSKEDLQRARTHPACGPEWKEIIDARLAALEKEQAGPAPGGYRGSRPPTR